MIGKMWMDLADARKTALALRYSKADKQWSFLAEACAAAGRDVARKRDKTGITNPTVFTISQQELSKRCMVDMYTSLWQTAQHRER